MDKDLQGKVIAILATDGVEQLELTEPRKALEQAGAKTMLLSIKSGQIKGWNTKEWGDMFDVDTLVGSANINDYDGLVLPGGVMNPDFLRSDEKVIDFIKRFYKSGKPIASICHGPWTLIEAGIVRGKIMTSWPSLQTDLRNAGAKWVDKEVVVDQGLVTSRNPNDIPAFNKKMIEEFHEGIHERQYA